MDNFFPSATVMADDGEREDGGGNLLLGDLGGTCSFVGGAIQVVPFEAFKVLAAIWSMVRSEMMDFLALAVNMLLILKVLLLLLRLRWRWRV